VTVVGLYLNPPDKAIVLCIDEKSQVQGAGSHRAGAAATTRCAGETDRRLRPATAPRPLFAALDVATGKVTDACYPRHRHEEFPALPQACREGLSPAAAARRGRQLRHPQAPGRDILAGQQPAHHPALHPDLELLAETWWRSSSASSPRQAIRRGTFTSVKDLIAAIEIFIDAWNERCKTLHLDQDRRPDPPALDQRSSDFNNAALASFLEP